MQAPAIGMRVRLQAPSKEDVFGEVVLHNTGDRFTVQLESGKMVTVPNDGRPSLGWRRREMTDAEQAEAEARLKAERARVAAELAAERAELMAELTAPLLIPPGITLTALREAVPLARKLQDRLKAP